MRPVSFFETWFVRFSGEYWFRSEITARKFTNWTQMVLFDVAASTFDYTLRKTSVIDDCNETRDSQFAQ